MSLEWHIEPSVKIGQEVFYIAHEDNCPAALKQRWKETEVLGYEAVVANPNVDDLDALKIICTGYRVKAFLFNHEPDVCLKCGEPHKSVCVPGDVLRLHQVYLTQEEVEKAVQWYPIELTAQEWMNLHGARDDGIRDLEYEKEHYKEEVIKRKDLEDKIRPLERELAVMRHPWYNLNEGAEPVSIEDAELGPCCANVSHVRDLLMKASLYGGLIRRDVEDMFDNLYGCSGEIWFLPSKDDMTVWNKVLSQLPAEEILKTLNSDD